MWIAPQSSSKLSWNYSMDRYTLTGSPSTAREPLIDSDFAAVAPSVYLSSKYHLPSAIIMHVLRSNKPPPKNYLPPSENSPFRNEHMLASSQRRNQGLHHPSPTTSLPGVAA
ncbi:hypothetical protein LZ554_003735 [Drepanopeziza brunnea f. sp. 'monogermtubi']|nr:hypothetical protein LZ554_003735 [Drepanopeziza brunnea f. sp. 'monogermtubi']